MQDFFISLSEVLVPIGICVVLPIMIVWLNIRKKLLKEGMRKEIILAALDKDANINIEELVKQMNKPNKLLKEKLLNKLQWGLATTFLGIGMIAIAGCIGGFGHPKDIFTFGLIGAVLLAVGIAFIISYVVGRKMLAKEMEAEEQEAFEMRKV